MMQVIAAEFALAGLIAGAAGALLGSALASLLLTEILRHTTMVFQPMTILIATALTGAGAAATGCLASINLLRMKPMSILREL
jgi:ABC-type antimicrobial peptide transport system permease subunit